VSFPSPSGSPPLLVGRERELATLRQYLDAALAGQGSLVLIGGEAGVGKTALAQALCHEAGSRDALVLIGRCYDLSETPPYGPWAEALAQYSLSPGCARGGIPSPPDALHTAARSSQQFFAEVRDFLAAASAHQPLLVVLDDVQWADPASLDLLRFLARSLSTSPLLLLVTYRSEALDDHHPFAQLIPLLVRESRAARLALAPLSATALHTLVQQRYHLDAADADKLVAYLARRTAGNALFASEMLRTLEDRGVVAIGGETLGDLADVAVPSLLRQIVVGRVGRLGVAAADLLGIAAVIGQQVPLDLWAAVSGRDEGTIEAVAERGLATRLLVETRAAGEVAFAHALIREALYEAVPALRRRRWHRTVGEVLAAGEESAPDAVAYHFRAAGDARAAAWLTRAGWEAYRGFAHTTARARFEEAQPLLEGREQARVLLALAHLDRFLARGLGYAEEAVAAAEGTGDEILSAVARFRLGATLAYRGRLDEALAAMEVAEYALADVADAALPDFGAIPGLDFQTHPGLALTREFRGHCRAAVLASCGRWHEVFALLGGSPETMPEGLSSLTANVMLAVAWVNAFLGHLATAQRAIATLHTMYVTIEDDLGSLTLHLSGGMLLLLPYLLDDPDARQRYDHDVAAASRRVEAALGAIPPLLNRCPLLIVTGQWEEARALWAQRHSAVATDVAMTLPYVGAMARAQGERDEAWALVREGVPDGPQTEPGTAHFVALDLYCLAARLALDEGDDAQARQWLEAHDRWLAWAGAEVCWGRANGHLAWAEYYRARHEPDAALRQAQQARAAASTPRQPLMLLAAHRLVGELATEVGRFAAAAENLRAALALAAGCGAPYERALTLLALAALQGATGEGAAAQETLNETRRLCTPLGAHPTLARAERLAQRLGTREQRPRSTPDGLSPREYEVLRLIVAGRNNPEIAEALSLSVRTVERHVENLYRKIDVHGRAEATTYAFQHGLI
jgi:DNA-binding CsgD family transcriptional regulator